MTQLNYYIKIHTSSVNSMLAISDVDIIGKSFIDGELKLDISERFYKGELVNINKIIDLITKFSNISIVGVKIINELKKLKYLKNEDIREIDGIPYTMVVIL